MSTNTVARAMVQDCFAVKETTKGTAVFPTAATHRIVTAGTAEINQQATFSDSEEIANSLDILDRFQDQMGAGSFSVPMYLRPSGTAGTAPMGDILLESLMGVGTKDGTVKYSFTQATTKPSFTLWIKKSHTVFFATGSCIESGTLNLTNQGGAKLDMSGGFMKMGWAGTDIANAAVTAKIVAVENAKLFTAGAYIQLGTDHNTNQGYRIASVDYDTNTLTMDDTITAASGVVVKGFLPTFTAVGEVLENKNTTITFDTVSKNLKSLNLSINSPVAWQTDEITISGYVTEYIEDRRSITSSIDVLFREQDLSYFYDATQNTQVDVIITIADGAGKTCTINLPYTELEVPNITTSSPTVSLSISGTSLGNLGEDSCSIVFT